MRYAHKAMAREWDCSPERIEALLSIARRDERIRAIWAGYLENRAEEDHTRTEGG